MKKEYLINLNYSFEISEKEDISCNTITTLNCKPLPETESINNNRLVKENESAIKNNNLDLRDTNGTDFEEAIKATGFGKFNFLILLAGFWGYMSCMYATTSISLILPSAECDLDLSNFDKGLLNSIIFLGMISSAFFWGLVSDAIGRKNVLMFSFVFDSLCAILAGLAQNFSLLLLAKLFGGFISSAPISILSSYLAENHANTYRSTVLLTSGFFTSFATFTLPILAWVIIPQPIRWVLFNGYITLPSWRIFLLVAATPSILAFITLCFLDESPKFLMFQGKNEEAMRVFKRIYHFNTGRSSDTFPVKCLRNEMGNDQTDNKKSVKEVMAIGWKQMVPMFQRPYFPFCLLPCVIQFCTLFAVNTIRLWSPQLFSSAIECEKYSYNITISTICDLLVHVTKSDTVEDIARCGKHVVEDRVYFNAMITGIVTGVGYLISSQIVRMVEKKWLMMAAYTLSISCCVSLYWSTSSNYMLGVISVYIAVTSTSATAVISAVIEIFPTSLRTTAVSLCFTFGRLGAMLGNIVFPLLLDWHCTAPFILLACNLLSALGLTLFLPKTKGKRLE